MITQSKQEEVIELVNKLFNYTDSREWGRLQGEVFSTQVFFDMSSLGGGPGQILPSRLICERWKTEFEDIDQVHHQAANFIVEFHEQETEANVFCYAIATHFSRNAINGKTREFVGSYQLHASLTDIGWRLDKFTYLLKYMNGNIDLK